MWSSAGFAFSLALQAVANSPSSSRFSEWVLTLILFIPTIFVICPGSFSVPDLLRTLDCLWLQLRLLGRAEMEILLVLLIILGILSLLYVRQLQFLVSEYESWYPHRAPPPRPQSKAGEVRVRCSTLVERRQCSTLTPLITAQSVKDLRSPTSFQRED